MKDNTALIIDLLTHWQVYTQSDAQPTLASFSRWLYEKASTPSEVSLYQNDIQQFIPEADQNDLLNAEISMLWGQIDNYRALLFKHILKELDINGIDEYTLLLFVELHQNPSKKEYVQRSLLEPTTSFEMIRRLQRKGLLAEAQNPKDRRSALMTITPEGANRLKQAKQRLVRVNQLLYTSLNPVDKPALLATLQRMITDVSHALEITLSSGK
ncbi:DNA-binding MarR family transcriptional regulator [Spirosoma lacussanchae]|uniref:MarR family winged helix-turn-helix transcriptional regulator n=1 Tax=Spirosoma lacussanchae TaxID=1884249 RepID=UPI0011097A03|nr:winged helix DNA-binding protein [Spirosoma lacussanchae]